MGVLGCIGIGWIVDARGAPPVGGATPYDAPTRRSVTQPYAPTSMWDLSNAPASIWNYRMLRPSTLKWNHSVAMFARAAGDGFHGSL